MCNFISVWPAITRRLPISKRLPTKTQQNASAGRLNGGLAHRRRMGEDILTGVSVMQRMIAQYFVFLRRVARSDTTVHYSFWRLFHHLDTLEGALFNPVLLYRALRFWIKLKLYAMFGQDPEAHTKKPSTVHVDVHVDGKDHKAAKAS